MTTSRSVRAHLALFVLVSLLCACGDSDNSPDAGESQRDASARDGSTSNGDAGKDACVPRACQASQCGAVADGCGGMLMCKSCVDAGPYAGGDAALSKTADARSYPVTGSLTQPGVPLTCPGTYSLTFTETTRKTQVNVQAKCEFTDIGFTFSARLYPGTYDVSASRNYEALGTVGSVVVDAAAISDVKLEAYKITVSGQILANHTPFMSRSCTSNDALLKMSKLTWTDLQSRKVHSFDVRCGSGNPWSYSATLPPGSYQVDLDPVDSSSLSSIGFPDAPVRVLDSVEIGKDPLMRTLDLNVAIGTLTGSVTRNGQPIAETCASFETPYVKLTDARNPTTTLSLTVSCVAGNWSFSNNWVYAGTYVVSYGGLDKGLPLANELKVQEGSNTLLIDEVQLKGTITVNGAVPSAGENVAFEVSDVTGKLKRSVYPTCAAESCSFDTFLPVGSYAAKLWHRDAHGYLPLATMLKVEAAQDNLSLDFSGVHISGAIQRNLVPVVGTTCRQGSNAATVVFKNLETQLEYPLPVTCDTSKGWLFAGIVPVGKYRAEIAADYIGSPFSAAPKLLASELTIEEDNAIYTLNAPAKVTLSAEVKHNGQPVSNDSYRHGTDLCASWQLSFESASEKTNSPVPFTCKSGKLRVEATLYQATYAVKVGLASNPELFDPKSLSLPTIGNHVIDSALVLTQDRSDVSFDLQSRVLDLELKRDGQPIMDKTCTLRRYEDMDIFDYSEATFTSLTTAATSKHTVKCDGTRWWISARLYPDTYLVDILPGPNSSLAEPGTFRAFDRLVIE